MKELSDKHTNFIKKLKQNLADVTQENDNLKGQMRGMTQ
jgi:predicted  nucleic acid-binding Zn-ribbon protein